VKVEVFEETVSERCPEVLGVQKSLKRGVQKSLKRQEIYWGISGRSRREKGQGGSSKASKRSGGIWS